jgi:hypothetical protein
MSESITISFVGTRELKTLLEKWAAADDRSVSYVMRQILRKEAQCREQAQAPKQQPINRQSY